ncbi:mannosyltransferase putative-domain-containing protein [Cercophora scortea]|uniref:Mannosyltransferase putative-domain-containing protein n=1 Tax=Cercophora scortea TaxID=314031 RepID=A0AAE0MMA0_9PEZI|nr:mannosyltransferase putative-domain-containing protein [Cercophora scortea]
MTTRCLSLLDVKSTASHACHGVAPFHAPPSTPSPLNGLKLVQTMDSAHAPPPRKRPGRHARSRRSRRAVCLVIVLALLLIASFCAYYLHLSRDDASYITSLLSGHGSTTTIDDASVTLPTSGTNDTIQATLQDFQDNPLGPPYKDVFGALGERTRIVKDWLLAAEASTNDEEKAHLSNAVEQAVLALFPFMRGPVKTTTPLADLRASFDAGSAGIVIATGDRTVRFCAHVIATLRSELRTSLPIQIVYAGDADLSPTNRDLLSQFVEFGPALEFLDIETVFDVSTLAFNAPASGGGWALKAFAALGSRFERVLLLDADVVFLQQPEALLTHPAFTRTGALFFHDRLLWQHNSTARHAWWRAQITHPSATLNRSLAWTEDYAEEQDSGVVVLDKSRAGVVMGLLHTCWQNVYDVRMEATYKLTYGDKETWWMGLELAGVDYEFEKHYAAMVGWEETADENGRRKVCSFVIAHVDAEDRLLWYNGGLLKNKAQIFMTQEFEVPLNWMIDAEWEKEVGSLDMSCMVGGEVQNLTVGEVEILTRFIDKAKKVDLQLLAAIPRIDTGEEGGGEG